MTASSEATSADPILLCAVARSDWTPERDERLFAHAFGGSDRVLGFGGKLRHRDGGVYLEQFVLCCTGSPDPDQAAALRESIAARLERAGWQPRPAEPFATSPSWTAGGSELTWVEAGGSDGASPGLVHLVLTHVTPEEELFRRVFKLVSDHIPGLDRTAGPRRAPASAGGTELSPHDLVREIERRRPIVYTGAGVSRASGIATFEGEESLGAEIPLHDSFPGAALDWMIERPALLASRLGAWQARLLSARPNPAHRAIAHLERLRSIELVLTNNFDTLHEAAGSRAVRRPYGPGDPIPSELAADLLLVTGISTDEHRVIEGFRRNGGQVIAIDPIPPRFLMAGDGYIRGSAEVVFPKVVDILLAERVAGSGEQPRPPWTAEGFREQVRSVQAAATTTASSLHGDRHWRRVAWLGAHLAAEVPGCDPWIVLLFALLHDSRRVNEDFDPEHGRRAAELARELNRAGLGLEASRLELLESACCFHPDGDISHDPTVGVCWDADRLDLWRCGLRPEPRYLSTGAALDPSRIEWSSQPVTPPHWPGLYRQFERL